MRILFDIGHPAHVHFFKHAIRLLQARHHDILITSRDKEFALELLNQLNLPHTPLSRLGKGGLFTLGKELIQRNFGLWRVVRRFKPDIMAAIGGICIAQVGFLTRVPSLVFYDTENARLQNALTYPFASQVIVPQCYETWLPKRRHLRYAGYHELAYLHPQYFTPDRNIALENGLSPQGDTFFLRLVSWQANHDIGEEALSTEMLGFLINQLQGRGKLLISSESPLPPKFQQYAYRGQVAQVHHVMGYCRLLLGESATMASEAAVLGVPALYIARTGRGYTNEQERKYQLVINIHDFNRDRIRAALDALLAHSLEHYQQLRRALLDSTIDVSRFIVNCLESYPTLSPQLGEVNHS